MSDRLVTIHTDNLNIAGFLVLSGYSDGSLAMILEPETDPADAEVLSTHLGAHGLVAPEGHVYIKDYSEHTGLADALESAGIITKIEHVTFGPFGTKAWLVRINEGASA